jgi:hypothetical protein
VSVPGGLTGWRGIWARIEPGFVAWGLQILPLLVTCPVIVEPVPRVAPSMVDGSPNRLLESDAYR